MGKIEEKVLHTENIVKPQSMKVCKLAVSLEGLESGAATASMMIQTQTKDKTSEACFGSCCAHLFLLACFCLQ